MSQTDLSSPDGVISALSDLGPMRVWSVIITIFGDVVRPRGGVVSAAALNAIGARLGIKPEAMRVALFRLVKDGWIERRKEGRNSFYVLTPSGKEKFLPATQRIYAAGSALRGPWSLAVLSGQGDAHAIAGLERLGFFALSNTVFLGGSDAQDAPDEVMILRGDLGEVPGWVRARIAPDGLNAEFGRLVKVLETLENNWPRLRMTPLDCVCLRVLMIHHWRRLLLRHPDVPMELLPADWQGERCRASVLRLHAVLSNPAEPWLAEMIGPSQT